MAEFWTTEQVADHLGIDPQTVYESRRRGAFPGNVGTRRGRRLLFRSDLIEAGPTEATTDDPLVALLWTAQGIEAKIGELVRLAEAQARSRLALEAPTHIRTKRELLEQWVGGIISAKEVREAMEEEE